MHRKASTRDGRFVWVDTRIESLSDPLVFKYKLSDGLVESIAEVEITLAEVTQAQRTAMVDAIKKSASKEFGLSMDQITVESVAYFDGDVLPAPQTSTPDSAANGKPSAFFGPVYQKGLGLHSR